jgi:hypothetical protein
MKIEWAETNQLIYCDCNTPFLKRVSNKILEFVKFHKKEPIKRVVQYSGDQFRIKCEKCGGNLVFIHLDDSFQIGDEVAIIKVPMAGFG